MPLHEAILEAFAELGKPATLNDVATLSGVRNATVRDHVLLHITLDDDGEFVDAFGFEYRIRDGLKRKHYFVTGKPRL